MLETIVEQVIVSSADVSSILVVDETFISVIDAAAPEVIHIGATGPQGPPGAASGFSNGSAHIEFQWNNVTTLPISVVTGGKLIIHCAVIITTPFNGTAPELKLGDMGDTSKLIAPIQVDPSTVGEYSVSPQVVYTSSTQVVLTITPGGGATQGAGLVVIEVQA